MKYEDEIAVLENALQDYTTSSITLREIAKKYKICRQVASGYFLGKGIDIYSKKSGVNNYAFSNIETEEQAYWLGFMYADGSVSHRQSSSRIELSLQERDYGHLRKFADFVDYRGEIQYREKQKAYRVCFGSNRMHEDLIRLGCLEKKSLILRFPNSNIVPDKLRGHFIRGYFDGDGHLDVHQNIRGTTRKTVSLLGTHEFLSNLLFYLPFDIPQGRIIKKSRNNDANTYYFHLRMKESALFLDYIYKDANVYLDRKYLSYIA